MIFKLKTISVKKGNEKHLKINWKSINEILFMGQI